MRIKSIHLGATSIILFLMAACSNTEDLKVAVVDSDTHYKFSAQYNRAKTVTVQQYVNASLKPNRIFADHQEKIAKDIRLADGSVFRLESSPGDFSIEFGKKENSDASYENIRKICSGIKEIVTEK